MKDVQCKKNRNEVIPVSTAMAEFQLDSVCHSCLEFDKCREAWEQAEIDKQSN
jgi:hypothetical protein